LAAISPAFLALPIVFLMLTLYSASAWAQTPIKTGDIVVPFGNAFGGKGGILKIDGVTGAQTTIACNPGDLGCPITGTPGYLDVPVSVAIESTGNIVVANRRGPTGSGAVVRVNPQTGAQTLLASGSPFIDPFGITIGNFGVIYITDTGCAAHGTACPTGTANAKVYSIDPLTSPATVTLISTGQYLRNPFGIEAESTGTLVVTDAVTSVPPFTGAGGIIRVNPVLTIANTVNNNQSALHVSTADVDGCPFGVTVDGTGQIYNSLFHNPTPRNGPEAPFPPLGCAPGAIWRALPLSGTNSPVSSRATTGIAWLAPFGMAVDTNGTILVVDESYKALYRMNPDGTLFGTAPLSQFTELPQDVAVYTAANTPPPLNGPDLSVTKTDGVTAVTAGDGVTYTYTITVTNNTATMSATGVTLTDTWPAGFKRTSLSCTPTSGMSTGNGSFTCNLGTIAPSTSTTVTATYTVPSSTTGSQTNTATVSSTTSDPNTSNNTASDTNTVTTSANLSVMKSDGVDTVTAGDGVTRTYTITVTNAGPSDAANVTLDDSWPAGFNRTATSASCSPSTGNGNFTCSLGTLAAGASTSVTASYTVPSTTTGSQANSVTVSSSTSDPNSNNTATDTNMVATRADLSVTKTDGTSTVMNGDSRQYAITVKNNGPSQATNVMVTDTWPAGFNRTGTSAGCSPSTGNGNFTCSLGTLAAGASATITANYTVPATTTGSQTNKVTVSSATSDPNLGNNTDSDTDTVTAPATSADLMITKADRPDPVATNATLVYTLTIRNNGPNAAQSVTVTDNLPATVTFQSTSASGWNCTRSGQTVTCTRASMNPGTSSTISIYVKAPSQPGTITNTASVTSATFDPVPGNNSDSETTTVIQQVTPAKWTGSGKIRVNGGYASFGFTVKKKKNGVVQGQLDFDNLVTKLDVDSISITSLVVSGNTATFSGTVRERRANGPSMGPYNFTVTVQDNGDPGKGRDTFRIQISDPYGTNEGGTLTQGNIEQNTWDSRDDNDDRE